ncbi:hypothetical protein ANCCEY_05523 [Ancylostoma ceylanicum]|uniref:DNA2/NAM7 helicase-like C-terminal domain-containing protein n=2 Tax=Ancylostoma ceylanicum TaxID=53326 RepID=A0A0D6LU97_9BILA|nr:hypothetical protein ANCCEY_05523 [Ancylostoma ceylanicum]EYC00610.1 hypothetical protein Y032_0114g437 [Ancylostoma ceylanicum]
MIDTLLCARAVPVAPLVTTFRAHPALNALPNRIAYNGTLISGAREDERRLLLDIVKFPNPQTPFVFVDVEGSSVKSASHSHSNIAEAGVCRTLVDGLLKAGVSKESIAIITFYKEQHRQLEVYARTAGVDLSTVDAIQGREKDAVVLLTTKTDFDPETSEFLD